MTWDDIWNGFLSFFTTSGLTILKVIGIWIVGYLVIKIMMLVLKKIFSKTKMEKVTQGFFLSVIKFVLYMILIVMILGQLGVEITGIVTALAAAGLAIGLALQNSLSNVASGIILLITHPFKEGDYVDVNGTEGQVHNIKILTTALITTDNKLVVLPNSTVANNAIINYSNRKTRRVEFNFTVDYNTDTDFVKKIILDVMKSNGKIRLDPAPFCALKTLNDSSLGFFAYCWCSSPDYWDVYYYVVDNVFNEFKRSNINIPYNQLEVRLRDDQVINTFRKTPLSERVEIKKEEKDDDLLTFFKNFNLKEKFSKKGKKSKQKQENKKLDKKVDETNNKNTAESKIVEKSKTVINKNTEVVDDSIKGSSLENKEEFEDEN